MLRVINHLNQLVGKHSITGYSRSFEGEKNSVGEIDSFACEGSIVTNLSNYSWPNSNNNVRESDARPVVIIVN